MIRKVILILTLGFRAAYASPVDPKTSKYILTFQAIAIEQMDKYKIPASITMAQGILESNCGESWLTQKSNNHFGIKCHSSWMGEKTYADDDQAHECFRVYATSQESFEDHSLFLLKNKRYATLFTLSVDDYKGWAEGLQKAGYATNPSYAKLLISLIEKNELYTLDRGHTIKDMPSTSHQPLTSDAHNQQGKSHSPKDINIHPNRLRYIIAREGDTYYKIAKRTGLTLHQLRHYNEVNPNGEAIQKGDFIYLDPKRRHDKNKDELTLTYPKTLRTIAQEEGLKIKPLLRRNHVSSADEPLPRGRKVFLR